MKNTTEGANRRNPTPKKLPLARVSYWKPDDRKLCRQYSAGPFGVWTQACAVIPAHTPAQSRRIVKAAPFLLMSEEEQVERLKSPLDNPMCGPIMSWQKDYIARAVLACMGLNGRAGK